MVCDGKKVSNLVSLKVSCPQLNTIVVFEETAISEEERAAVQQAGIQLYSMKQIEVWYIGV